ncbi:MAG: hypothetical protein Kow0069_22190 [Promethearchaeota archaeon]
MASLTFVGVAAGIMSLVAGAANLALCLMALAKWREKRASPTLFLALSAAAYSGACWFGTITYFTSPFSLSVATITNALIYVTVFAATIFMFLFARIFFEPKRWQEVLYVATGAAVALVIAVTDSVYIDSVGDYPVIVLKDAYAVAVLAYLVPTYLGIFSSARRARARIDEPVYRAGFGYVSIGVLMPLLTFVADTGATLTKDLDAIYTIFLMLTWVFPILATTFMYLGYMLPGWLRARLEHQRQA